MAPQRSLRDFYHSGNLHALRSLEEVVMKYRLLTAGSLLLCATLLHAQSEPKAGTDAANKEAQRQGQVALQPNARQSPSQTIQQAVAFERYKEMAAEREAQKEASAANTESGSARHRHTAAVGKQK
jgi:hypothetical protein